MAASKNDMSKRYDKKWNKTGTSRTMEYHPKTRANALLNKRGTSDGFKNMPHPMEDVAKGTKEDVSRVKKYVNNPSSNALGRDMQKLSAQRAGSRLAGRASGVVGAALIGYDAGTALNEKYNLSGKLVDAIENVSAKNEATKAPVKVNVKEEAFKAMAKGRKQSL